MGHEELIVEPTEDGQALYVDVVLEHPEHLLVERILGHAIEMIKSGLSCPTDI